MILLPGFDVITIDKADEFLSKFNQLDQEKIEFEMRAEHKEYK